MFDYPFSSVIHEAVMKYASMNIITTLNPFPKNLKYAVRYNRIDVIDEMLKWHIPSWDIEDAIEEILLPGGSDSSFTNIDLLLTNNKLKLADRILKETKHEAISSDLVLNIILYGTAKGLRFILKYNPVLTDEIFAKIIETKDRSKIALVTPLSRS